MIKSDNNLIFYGLGILAILTLGIMPSQAMAFHTPYNIGHSIPEENRKPVVQHISPTSANYGESAKTITITGGNFVPNAVGRVDGSARPTTFIDSAHLLIHLNASDMTGASGHYINVFNPAPGGGYSNALFFTINGYVEPDISATTQNSNSGGATYNNGNAYPATATTGQAGGQMRGQETVGDLAASVVFGTTTFMPSGIVQWIFFAILILLIVILVRKVFRGEEKYQETPLKHS